MVSKRPETLREREAREAYERLTGDRSGGRGKEESPGMVASAMSMVVGVATKNTTIGMAAGFVVGMIAEQYLGIKADHLVEAVGAFAGGLAGFAASAKQETQQSRGY